MASKLVWFGVRWWDCRGARVLLRGLCREYSYCLLDSVALCSPNDVLLGGDHALAVWSPARENTTVCTYTFGGLY